MVCLHKLAKMGWKQRLSIASLLFFLSLTAAGAQAPGCAVQENLIVTSLNGHVYDETGEPLPNADVALLADGQPLERTLAGLDGKFKLGRGEGAFTMVISLKGYAPLRASLKTKHSEDLFGADQLYVILGPDGTGCSSITTDKKKFAKQLRLNKQRVKGIKEEHATQK